MENKIIWQPSSLYPSGDNGEIGSYEFKIDLNWDFARRMLNSKIKESGKEGLNEIALKKFNTRAKDPFEFFENTGLLRSIRTGTEGRWITTDIHSIYSLSRNENKESLEYHTHNVDNLRDAYTFLDLFELWAYSSEILIK